MVRWSPSYERRADDLQEIHRGFASMIAGNDRLVRDTVPPPADVEIAINSDVGAIQLHTLFGQVPAKIATFSKSLENFNPALSKHDAFRGALENHAEAALMSLSHDCSANSGSNDLHPSNPPPPQPHLAHTSQFII